MGTIKITQPELQKALQNVALTNAFDCTDQKIYEFLIAKCRSKPLKEVVDLYASGKYWEIFTLVELKLFIKRHGLSNFMP